MVRSGRDAAYLQREEIFGMSFSSFLLKVFARLYAIVCEVQGVVHGGKSMLNESLSMSGEFLLFCW